jgi:predicted transcriptional regulator
MTETPEMRIATLEGSYLTPSFQHARVADAMRTGVIACPPDTSMESVARIMSTNHVHAVMITGLAGGAPWGIVSDGDLLEVAGEASERLAGSCAAEDPVMVKPSDRLADAVELMRERQVSHLVVGDTRSDQPIGILSTLDVAGIVGWGRG